MNKKKLNLSIKLFILVAESEGFEPPVPCGTMVFKTTAFDHSANSPTFNKFLCFSGCKYNDVLLTYTSIISF